jgi:hypothetical protein
MRPQLLLFTTEVALARECLAAGVDSVVVDWETKGKHERQLSHDTEINADSPEDICQLRQIPDARVYCRVNAYGPGTADEVDLAIDAGATDLFLPMVTSPTEAARFLECVAGRARAGILVETLAACAQAAALARLPWDAVYVGLNDLAIDRGSSSIFAPLADGLALQVRNCFSDVPFGIGGLTVVDQGHPIPCLLLMGELQRLRCDFTFLRRSFKRDIVGRDIPREVRRIRQCWMWMESRTKLEVERDHRRFCECVHSCRTLQPEIPESRSNELEWRHVPAA